MGNERYSLGSSNRERKKVAAGSITVALLGSVITASLHDGHDHNQSLNKDILQVESTTPVYARPFQSKKEYGTLKEGESVVAKCYVESQTIGVDYIAISTDNTENVGFAPVWHRGKDSASINNFNHSSSELKTMLPECKINYVDFDPSEHSV